MANRRLDRKTNHSLGLVRRDQSPRSRNNAQEPVRCTAWVTAENGCDRRLKKQHDSDEKTTTVTGGEAHAHTPSAGAIRRLDIIPFEYSQLPAPVRQDKNPAKPVDQGAKPIWQEMTVTAVRSMAPPVGAPRPRSNNSLTGSSHHSKTRRKGRNFAEKVVELAIESLVYPTYDTKGRLDTAVDNFIEWLTGKIQTDLFSNQTPKKPSQLLKKAEEAVQAPSKS
ncbi:hypothetical protein CF319_g5628 [Tilletia indica]|nr:hypothetical protein CF319_g5628 [Tilletia indica]